MPNPMNGRRQELVQPDARLLSADADLRQNPAFRLHVRRSLRMHPVLAGAVAGAVLLLLVLFALARKPSYSAESLIYVEPLEVRVLSDGSSSGYDPSRYDSYLQQQVQTVERADTLEAALAKLPPGMWSTPGQNPASATGRLEGALKVERVMNSYQLAIDVTASDPKAAAAAANAVTAAYLEEGRKDEHARADQRLQLLTEERQRITDDMTQDKAEQAHLGSSLGVANPNGVSGNPYDMQSEGLRSQLAAAREAHDTVAAQLASVSGANGTGLDTAANELIGTDPGLVSIKQTLSQRRALLSDQMAGLTPTNPVYRQDQEEINTLDRAMDRATAEARERAERQLQDKLRLDLRRTADVEGRLNAQLAEQTAKATGAGPKLQRAAELETDLQRLSARYATVDDAIRGLQLETSGPGQAHLSLAARVPETAQPSRRKLILLLALPLALLCGIGAAVVARKRDPRLYLPDDLQEVLGFAPMGVLPDAGEVSAAAYDDFVLRLAGGLEGAYRHGNARSFVVTPVSVSTTLDGVLPQLSAKLQQIGFRAAHITAAQLIPRLTGSAGEVALVRAKSVRPREGVAATQLELLLRENDIILIQAPPLLGSALTEYAVRCADATILLVESSRTSRPDLRRAALLLERLNPQGVGAVLQKLSMRYADAAFTDAVRAADHASLRNTERVVEVPYEQAIVASASEAPPLESVRPATSAGPLPSAEELPHYPDSHDSVASFAPAASVASLDPPASLDSLELTPSTAEEDIASEQDDAEEEIAPMKLFHRWKKAAEPEHREASAITSAPAETAPAQTTVPPIFFIEESELRDGSSRWVPSGHGGFAPVTEATQPAQAAPVTHAAAADPVRLSGKWEEAAFSPAASAPKTMWAPKETWATAAFEPDEPLAGESETASALGLVEPSEPSTSQREWQDEQYAAEAPSQEWTAASHEELPPLQEELARPVADARNWEGSEQARDPDATSFLQPYALDVAATEEAPAVRERTEEAGAKRGWRSWTQTVASPVEETEEFAATGSEAPARQEHAREPQPDVAAATESSAEEHPSQPHDIHVQKMLPVQHEEPIEVQQAAFPLSEEAHAPSDEPLQVDVAAEDTEPPRRISFFRRLLGLEDEPALHISPVDERKLELTPSEIVAAANTPEPSAYAASEALAETDALHSSSRWNEQEAAVQSQPEELLEAQPELLTPDAGMDQPVFEEPVTQQPVLEQTTAEQPVLSAQPEEPLSTSSAPETSFRDVAEDVSEYQPAESGEYGEWLPSEGASDKGHSQPEVRSVEEDHPADWMSPYLTVAPSERDEVEARGAEAPAPPAPAADDGTLPSAAARLESAHDILEPSFGDTAGSGAEPRKNITSSPKSWKTEAFTPPLPPAEERTSKALSTDTALTRKAPSLPTLPSLVTPVTSERASREEARRSESPRRPLRWEPVTPAVRVRETTFLPQRPGLARAAAHAAADEGPPARASEGLTAMRTGAGLRKALVRQEAVLRPQSPQALATQAHTGMSRRWGMLSQFERPGHDSVVSADVEQRFPPTSERTVPSEPVRNSGV